MGATEGERKIALEGRMNLLLEEQRQLEKNLEILEKCAKELPELEQLSAAVEKQAGELAAEEKDLQERHEEFTAKKANFETLASDCQLAIKLQVELDEESKKELQEKEHRLTEGAKMATRMGFFKVEEKELFDEEIPDGFKCPITQEIMKDPVILETGQTYEREAIEKWLQEKRTDPATGQQLSSVMLIPNISLRKNIDEWRHKHELRNKPAEAAASSASVAGSPAGFFAVSAARIDGEKLTGVIPQR
jgi:DNA repair exonuclease SbcCD ATPase subunit